MQIFLFNLFRLVFFSQQILTNECCTLHESSIIDNYKQTFVKPFTEDFLDEFCVLGKGPMENPLSGTLGVKTSAEVVNCFLVFDIPPAMFHFCGGGKILYKLSWEIHW